MERFCLLLVLIVGLAEAQPRRILYLTTSAGYRHASIETSIAVLEDLSRLNATSLEQFDGVLFFTSGELPVSESQKSDLLEFVRSGKGFMGLHSFYTWPEYGDLMDILGYNRSGWTWKIPITQLQCLCDRRLPFPRRFTSFAISLVPVRAC